MKRLGTKSRSGSVVLMLVLYANAGCISETAEDKRNLDIFGEAKALQLTRFTPEPYSFSGNIAAGLAVINALSASSGADSGITDTDFEGVVSIPSSYAIGLGTDGCTTANLVYQRSFVLEDNSAAVLVAYGLEPPSQDVAQNTSMKYIANARNPGLAVFGHRVRLTAKRAVKYGGGTGTIPIITDFSNFQIISKDNAVSYLKQNSAFTRTTDLYRTRQIEGYVTQSPTYAECTSGSQREFQFNYQVGYMGALCVGAVSVADAANCTGGGKVEMKFQLSYALGAGTLSGFDTGDMFSYNFAKDAKVRLTGAVFPPAYNAADSGLVLMLTQRIQAETLR
ncbi:MAG: hypothetical protein OHK0011_00750 [Turneriella sp.]